RRRDSVKQDAGFAELRGQEQIAAGQLRRDSLRRTGSRNGDDHDQPRGYGAAGVTGGVGDRAYLNLGSGFGYSEGLSSYRDGPGSGRAVRIRVRRNADYARARSRSAGDDRDPYRRAGRGPGATGWSGDTVGSCSSAGWNSRAG